MVHQLAKQIAVGIVVTVLVMIIINRIPALQALADPEH